MCAHDARSDNGTMPSAATGFVETGTPSFVVLGPEAIGLSSAPTDLHLLPDGRVLATSQREIALGDGFRWEVFRAVDGQESIFSEVAVDAEGKIYSGIAGGIARIELGEEARWRLKPVSGLPGDSTIQSSTMVSVSTVGDNWFWYGGSGAIVTWRPGQQPKMVGRVSSIEHIFSLGDDVFISEQSSGGLYKVTANNGAVKRVTAAEQLASETVTCSVPFGPGKLLVGTSFAGLKIFDGAVFKPFVAPGILSGGQRVTDLCVAGEGLFAAAVDTVGIVFFDRSGRTLQVLDRSLDHRLARAQRLCYATNGVLWVLLNDGVARVEFPSIFSHFEPLVASGLAYAKPLRHDGKLWMLADGRAMRGVYDDAGRLERFQQDTPPGRYLFVLADVEGQLLGTNETGIFAYQDDSWKLVVPHIVNARVGLGRFHDAGTLYVARDEFGYLSNTPDGIVAHRIATPGLGDSYNAFTDGKGIIWIELGTSRVGRLDSTGSQPVLRIFGPESGLTDGWVEIYVFEGVARFHLPSHLFRFDEKTQNFVEDRRLLARAPQLASASGRPVTDKLGQLWYTALGNAHTLLPKQAAKPGYIPNTIPVGFPPTEYTLEENGVMWMFANRRLSRMDPSFPHLSAAPINAQITSVEFSATGTHRFRPGKTLEPVAYADNSLVIHFAAPANPFTSSVTFEVLLEGAGTQWVSMGTAGSASFNRLKEGDYVFHVRPIADGTAGGEAVLTFTIRPPWFRTPLAWVIYVLSAIGLVAFAAWLSAFLQRRENERLERVVTERTEELNVTNRQLGRQIQETTEKSAALAASEERYRRLNTDLEFRVAERTAQLSHSNEELQQRESLFRLIFEHAPVGISWKRTDLGDAYHFNPTFRRILDLPTDLPADYAVLLTLVHPDDSGRYVMMNRQIGSGKIDSYNLESRFVLKDGRIVWGSLSVAVIRDGEGRIVQDIGILEDISPRKRAEEALAKTYKDLVDTSRMAGMAEVATGVLHNVGNVLTSLNVSSNLIYSGLRQSKADSLVKLATLVNDRAATLGEFLTNDPKGRLVPELLAKLAEQSVKERDWIVNEITSMQKNIDHIKEIVAMQQSYATVVGVSEKIAPTTLFEDALQMNTAALSRHDVTVIREFLPVPLVCVEKGKILQILINLIRNAKYACDDGHPDGSTAKIMTVRIEPAPGERVRMIVRDNGIGISPENMTRVFTHGFTTRATGHGFGLHSSILAAKEMKASLTAYSDGIGKGATFILELPSASQPETDESSTARVFPSVGRKSEGIAVGNI